MGIQLAATAFLSNPDLDRARFAAMAFWRARGLASHPKIAIFPQPSAEQIAELRSCFDIVDQDAAELLLLLDVRGLQELLMSRINGATSALRSSRSIDRFWLCATDASTWATGIHGRSLRSF